jgi:hypothetical protein
MALNLSLFSPILKTLSILVMALRSLSVAALMLAIVPSFQPCLKADAA